MALRGVCDIVCDITVCDLTLNDSCYCGWHRTAYSMTLNCKDIWMYVKIQCMKYVDQRVKSFRGRDRTVRDIALQARENSLRDETPLKSTSELCWTFFRHPNCTFHKLTKICVEGRNCCAVSWFLRLLCNFALIVVENWYLSTVVKFRFRFQTLLFTAQWCLWKCGLKMWKSQLVINSKREAILSLPWTDFPPAWKQRGAGFKISDYDKLIHKTAGLRTKAKAQLRNDL